ncbi:HAD family hydrolase [Labrys okinawensis]|uniref:HAD family hydrolase n=1 Tax=Labrys okinawensis TaxID=346911 RepID=A0A2S9QGP2_9HYPH|nr:HAD family hydrolase [Labrys okinawensis]PRH88505.1 HAD family hydrolase [Labrys okinawensis]
MNRTRAIKAVAFDAFGTVVEIVDERRPYVQIARGPRAGVLASSITRPLDLAAFADLCGVQPSLEWKADLEAELASIRAFAESREVLIALRRAGYRVALASNLAQPYAAPLEALFADLLDCACFSFEIGAAKPDPAFYRALCLQLDCVPAEILMVGDSWRSDYEGARGAGLQALHLDRCGVGRAGREGATITDLRRLLDILPA